MATCRVCERPLGAGVERKLGRHTTCESSYDEDLLEALRAWRLEQAKERGVPAYVVFTDATLVAVAEQLPADESALLRIRGIGRVKVDTYGEGLLGVLRAHRS